MNGGAETAAAGSERAPKELDDLLGQLVAGLGGPAYQPIPGQLAAPLIQKLGVQSMAQLKEMKPTKLFNDLAGMRKKMKLEILNATVEEIEGWLK